jgi:hypothetical protein
MLNGMKTNVSPKIKALAGMGIAGIAIAGFVALYEPETKETSRPSDEKLHALAVGFGIATATPLQLPTATKKTHCTINGPYPDLECTPGALFTDKTVDEICAAGYTKTVRNVSAITKKKLYLAYGIKYPEPLGSYEADHFIPLELGGSNDVANLFPEAAGPPPGFKEKDIVENYLHTEMCAQRITLSEAQGLIAADWLKVYQSLSPEEISALKKKFKSWAD